MSKPKGQFVVSPNYRDRSDKVNRWLVRRIDQTEYDLASAVVCHGVTIHDAWDLENGYGCRLVALCESVEYLPADAQPVVLPYKVTYGGAFIACQNVLSGAHIMSLGADGSITANGIKFADKGKFDDYLDDGVEVENSYTNPIGGRDE